MILIILLITSFAYDNEGTLQINQSLLLNTNFTEMAPSVMIKFILPNNRLLQNDFTIGCFVSFYNVTQIDIESLQLSNNKSIVYDLHSIQSNSEIQVVTYNYYDSLYLFCQSNYQGEVKYQLTYKEDYFTIGCVNQCQGYNDTNSISQSYCAGDHCECQINQLGNFCQLQTTYLLNSNEEDLSIKAKSWIFFYYQFSTIDIELMCNQESETVWYSLTLRQIPQITIPNRSTAHQLKKNQSIYDQLQQMTLFDESNILYIGLFNDGNEEIHFKFELISNGSGGSDNLERNKIIIISVGSVIGALLVVTFLLSVWKTRRIQEEQNRIRQRQIALRQASQLRQQQQQQIAVKIKTNGINQCNLGFTNKFIKDYFGVVSYKKLIQIYPGLAQFEDCVICLESIKLGQTRSQRHCSVTPCFHVFHQKCLMSWLEKQKNCPFCRAEFTKIQIQSKYPWLDLKQQKQNGQSQYIKNLKVSACTEQSQDNKLNDSQQELVGKNVNQVEV